MQKKKPTKSIFASFSVIALMCGLLIGTTGMTCDGAGIAALLDGLNINQGVDGNTNSNQNGNDNGGDNNNANDNSDDNENDNDDDNDND